LDRYRAALAASIAGNAAPREIIAAPFDSGRWALEHHDAFLSIVRPPSSIVSMVPAPSTCADISGAQSHCRHAV
jgi:hypothetical protein